MLREHRDGTEYVCIQCSHRYDPNMGAPLDIPKRGDKALRQPAYPRLSDDEEEKIRALAQKGLSIAVIMQHTGRSRSAVRRVMPDYRRWDDLRQSAG